MWCFAKEACTRDLERAGALSWWSWSAHPVIVNATVIQYASSVNGVSLPTDYPHGRVSVHRGTVKSPLDWLPSYIKAMRPLLKIFKMAGYFPDRLRTSILFLGLLALSRKAPKVRPPARPSVSLSIRKNQRRSHKMDFREILYCCRIKICSEIPNFVTIGQKCRAL